MGLARPAPGDVFVEEVNDLSDGGCRTARIWREAPYLNNAMMRSLDRSVFRHLFVWS